jgi:hypothetical protein
VLVGVCRGAKRGSDICRLDSLRPFDPKCFGREMGKWRGNDWLTAGTSFAGLIETHWRHQSDTRNFRAMYVESGFPRRSRHDRCFRLDPCRLAHPGRAVGMPNRGSKLHQRIEQEATACAARTCLQVGLGRIS